MYSRIFVLSKPKFIFNCDIFLSQIIILKFHRNNSLRSIRRSGVLISLKISLFNYLQIYILLYLHICRAYKVLVIYLHYFPIYINLIFYWLYRCRLHTEIPIEVSHKLSVPHERRRTITTEINSQSESDHTNIRAANGKCPSVYTRKSY